MILYSKLLQQVKLILFYSNNYLVVIAKIEKSSETNKTAKRVQLLHLALAWDAIEIAKEHIIKDDLSDLDVSLEENLINNFIKYIYIYFQNIAKTKLFIAALKRNSPQFVNTFIKLNFDISPIFYQKRTNKPWKLIWDELGPLYNDNSKRNVR